jgi:4-hydroxy-2-oxoglutarate aldolase
VNGFSGLYIPCTTPFDKETGDVAAVHFRANIRKWLEEPIDGYVLFGSTGEGVLVDDDEKIKLIEYARELIPPGLKLIIGITADSTRAIIKKAKQLGAAGGDAFLIAPPPYFGAYLSPGAIADHYRAIADAVPAPVILYHIPKYTKVVMEAPLVAELVRHPNIIGIKDSSGDVKRFADFTNACGKECAIFVGNGALLYTALELGAAGGIVAVGQFAPKLCAGVIEAFRAGDARKAGQLQERITPMHKEIVAAHGAVGTKAALDRVGYYGGPPRSPLKTLSQKELQQMARTMQGAGILA